MSADARRPTVACLGEVLWDCFPDGKVLGGAPFNCAFMAQALGANAAMISRLGEDPDGREILSIMAARGMDAGYVQIDSAHDTGRVEVAVSEKGEPTFTILEDVAWDYIAGDVRTSEMVRSCDALCFGTLAQRNDTSREAILQFVREAGHAVRFYDVNLRASFFSKETIERSLSVAQVVKLNDDELETLKEMFPEAFQNGERSFMERFGVELLAVTRGGAGCHLFRGDENVAVPGVKVKVMDTVGSGDAFTASLILSCLAGASLREMAHEANLLGAFVASKRGATPSIDGYREAMTSTS